MLEENRKVRNVLVTSIMRDDDEDEVKYYYYSYGSMTRFGSRIARSEAAACAVLSATRLDEIIAVGRDTDINASDVLDRQIISNMSDLPADTQEMSDYCFFKYRLCEYINGVDFESSDIYEKVPKPRQEEIVSAIKYILGADVSRGFRQIHDEFALLERIYQQAGITSKEEKDLVKNFLFVNMRKEDKILPKEENKGIEITYLPVIMTDDKRDVIKNAQKLVELLHPNEDDQLNLYVDLQGFSLADGYTIFNLMNLLDIDSKYMVTIKSVTSLSGKKGAIDERLSDASSKYRTSELISGIEAFLNYGQTEIIREYWKKTGIKNDYISEFLYAMAMVDTGISLCDNDELIAGIKKVIACINDEERAGSVDLSSEEALFIMQIRHAVATDYADLIDKNGELDMSQLIKWEYRKGHYQQAMTIIESKTPKILAEHGILYYAQNEEDKEKMLAFLNDKYWKENPRIRWTFNDIQHYLIKSMPHGPAYDKHQRQTPMSRLMAELLTESFKDDRALGIRLYTTATDMDALRGLLECYYEMGPLRNKINHAEERAGARDEETDYTQMNPVWKSVSDGIRKFIDKMDKVLADVEGKEFTSAEISNEERTGYFNAHKFFPDGDRRGGRRQGGPGRGGQGGPGRSGNSNSNSNSGGQPCSVRVDGDNNGLHVYIDIAVKTKDLPAAAGQPQADPCAGVKTDNSSGETESKVRE